ncbi:hypothetical protein XELAEV_18033003mg [Xenopus laevis]|uniref:Uncharacterized protein n=1 Tax=Xenopus laevis TaxID=8355 RepID=A0A974CJZ7_XENLA|nr:hypothetical protein XELAEV_18033003mg [Xenopus laevis]
MENCHLPVNRKRVVQHPLYSISSSPGLYCSLVLNGFSFSTGMHNSWEDDSVLCDLKRKIKEGDAIRSGLFIVYKL